MAIRYSERTGQPQEYQAGPFDSAHLYLQWGGKLPGLEIWSCGLRLAGVGGGTPPIDDATLTAYANVVSGFHANPNTLIASACKLSFVKVNQIGTNGHYTAQHTNEKIIADIAGGGGSPQPPNQIALAISLLTGFSRGPAHRGRFYLPMPRHDVIDSNGQIGASIRDAIRESAAQFVTALNGVSSGAQVAVFSRKAGAPAHRLVSGVEVGRVLDTQRRRRNRLVEAY